MTSRVIPNPLHLQKDRSFVKKQLENISQILKPPLPFMWTSSIYVPLRASRDIKWSLTYFRNKLIMKILLKGSSKP